MDTTVWKTTGRHIHVNVHADVHMCRYIYIYICTQYACAYVCIHVYVTTSECAQFAALSPRSAVLWGDVGGTGRSLSAFDANETHKIQHEFHGILLASLWKMLCVGKRKSIKGLFCTLKSFSWRDNENVISRDGHSTRDYEETRVEL